MRLYGKAKGSKQMAGKIRGAKIAFQRAHETAVREEGTIELKEMKARTPVDTRPNAPHPGALRDSGKLEVERKGNTVSATFSFGDELVDYAVPVHEILETIHPIGQAKYAESVLNESAPHILDRIAQHVHFDNLRVEEE